MIDREICYICTLFCSWNASSDLVYCVCHKFISLYCKLCCVDTYHCDDLRFSISYIIPRHMNVKQIKRYLMKYFNLRRGFCVIIYLTNLSTYLTISKYWSSNSLILRFVQSAFCQKTLAALFIIETHVNIRRHDTNLMI